MTLERIGGLAIHIILSKLGPTDTASVACVSRQFKVWASDDDSLWSKFCSDDLNLSSPTHPLHTHLLPSFRVCYQTWREAFSMYPWPLVKRVKICWDTIKDWLKLNYPEVLSTLRKGASEDEISEAEKSLKVKLPLPVRLLYRFTDGQEFIHEQEYNGSSSKIRNLLGLIGGYAFYDHLVNVFLLPLSQMVIETKDIIPHLGVVTKHKYVIVAASSYNEKIFFLKCSNGQLYVGTRNLISDAEMLPCVPNGLLSSVHEQHFEDAMLLWLEEHARRLQSGLIKVRVEERLRSINLFPEHSPLCCTSITNGVKVRASAVLAPEFCNLQDDSDKFLFAYSIRLSLVPEGCIISGMTFNSCQLYRRHWIIRVDDAVVSDVNGEAVIGKFPLLRPGEEEFVYESCTHLPSSPGSIEGAFTFIPGRLADPKDNPFEVEVPKFPVQLPEYIF